MTTILLLLLMFGFPIAVMLLIFRILWRLGSRR